MRQNEIISKVLNDIDIVDEISKYLSVTRKGQNYFAVCPFHDDTRPSLVISKNKKIFKCFVCNEAGNVISFVSKYNKISFAKALYILAKSINLDLSDFTDLVKQDEIDTKFNKFFDANKQACQIYKNFLYEDEYKHALEFLYKRGLTDELIEEFEIGYAPKKNMLFTIMTNKDNFFGENREKSLIWSPAQLVEYSLLSISDNNEYIDFFSDRIIFPIKNDRGNIIGFSGREINSNSSWKYLNSKSSEFFQKNSELYNIDKVSKLSTSKVYITEGYMDVISSYKYGVKNIVATMGTAFNKNHIDLLIRNKINTVILAMDNDDAGKQAAEKIGIELIKNKINVYALNNSLRKHKDLDDVVNKENNETFSTIMENYYTFIDFVIDSRLDKDLMIDEKLSNVNYIEELISLYGDKNLISYYASKIASLTNLNADDIKNKIEQNQTFYNQIKSYDKNISSSSYNKQDKRKYSNLKKIFYMEQNLVFCMLNSSTVISLYIKHLNYMNLKKVSDDYNNIIGTLLQEYKTKPTSSDIEYIDIINNKINNKNFLDMFLNNYKIFKQNHKINNLDSIDIIRQGITLIIELIKERISSIKRDDSINQTDKDLYVESSENSIYELRIIYDKYSK